LDYFLNTSYILSTITPIKYSGSVIGSDIIKRKPKKIEINPIRTYPV
jgi:hypothetical protein